MADDLQLALKIDALVSGIKQVQGLANELRDVARQGKKRIPDNTKEARSGMERTRNSVSRLRNQVVALAVAFGATSAIKRFVSAGIEFNATIETARLGVASLVAAQAELRDSSGKVLTGQEALAGGMKIAEDQVQKLRIAGIQTAATFGQLLEAFQQAIGPGLAANLGLDDVRDITIQIVQAAGALGVPMFQVGQEVRAILDGSIDVNARLAKALGITNEMVATWKANNTLVEELNKRLEAFKTAGTETAKTWVAIKSNIADAASNIAGIAFAPLLDELKSAALDALNALFDTAKGTVSSTIQGLLTTLQGVARVIGQGIGASIRGIIAGIQEFSVFLDSNRETVTELGLAFLDLLSTIGGVVKSVAGAVGAFLVWEVKSRALLFTFRTLQLLVAGLKDGFNFIVAIVGSLGGRLQNVILDFLNPFIEGLAKAADFVGLNGNAIRGLVQPLRDANQAAIDYGDSVLTNFALGNTEVQKTIASWKEQTAAAKETTKAVEDFGKKTEETLPTIKNRLAPLSEELRKKLVEVRARVLEATGDIAGAQRLKLEEEFKQLLTALEKRSDAAGIALVKRLFNLETAQAQLDQLNKEFERAMARQQSIEQDIQAQRDNGLIGEIEARRRIVELHHETAEALGPVIEKMRQAAAAIGPDAVAKIDQVAAAVRRLGQEIDPVAQRIRTSVEEGLTGGFEKFFDSLREGKGVIKSLGDAFDSFADQVIRAIQRIAAERLAGEILKGFGFGATVAHSGGRIGSNLPIRRVSPAAFLAAPRLHAGGALGLAADEVPAILQQGEVVLSRDQVRGGSDVKVTVENRGTPIQASDAKVSFDGEGLVVRIITQDAQRGGPISSTLARTFGLRRSTG